MEVKKGSSVVPWGVPALGTMSDAVPDPVFYRHWRSKPYKSQDLYYNWRRRTVPDAVSDPVFYRDLRSKPYKITGFLSQLASSSSLGAPIVIVIL